MEGEVHRPRKINGGMVAITALVIGVVCFLIGLGLGLWFL